MRPLLAVIILLLVVPLSAACARPEAMTGAPGVTGSSVPATTASVGASPSADVARVPEQLRFTANTVAGGQFDGASLAGKPAVLWFWAPWCPKCRAEAEHIGRLADDSAGRVTFVGIAAQDQLPAMRRFVEQYGVDFTHVADLDAAIWRRFGVTYQPAYAFVDSSGHIEVVKDQLGGDQLADRVAALG